ncbi:MAG: tyrosine-type recombinase/integrase [Nitrospinaceae bacterium]
MPSRVQSFIDHITVEKRLAPNTIDAYRRDIQRFLKTIPAQDLKGLDRGSIHRYLLGLQARGISSRSSARILSSLRSFFRFLEAEGHCRNNPLDLIATPGHWKKLPGILTIEEVDALLQTPNTATAQGLRDKAMLEALYATGLRVTELVNLQIGNLDLDAGWLRTLGKGGKERVIPLGETALDCLKQYLRSGRVRFQKSAAAPDLFLTNRGRRLLLLCCNRVWEKGLLHAPKQTSPSACSD